MLSMKINKSRSIITAVAVVIFSVAVLGQQRLMVVGGGNRPVEATKKFVEWSGGPKSKILIITWATAEEDSSFDGTKKAFLAANAAVVEHAVTKPLDPEKRAKLVTQ